LDLWDKFESVDKHNQHGIQFFEQYAKYVKERSQIETEYANKIKRLVKSYTPKKKYEEMNVFSTFKAFYAQLIELGCVAKQRELVSENMVEQIVEPCLKAAQEMKQEKKKLYAKGREARTKLADLEKQMENSKKKFEKEWKEYERLNANYERLDQDQNATKADVEKAKSVATSKRDHVDQCKYDYGAMVSEFNKLQKCHYYEEMPQILESYRTADEKRALEVQKHLTLYGQIEQDVGPIVNKCLDVIKDNASAIDPEVDSALVIDMMKTGFQIPGDREFEDYTDANHKQQDAMVAQNSQKGRKKGGLFGLFGRGEKKSNSDGNISRNNSIEFSPNRTSRSPTRQPIRDSTLNRDRSTSVDSNNGQSVKNILKDSIQANGKKLKTLFKRSSTVSSPKAGVPRERSSLVDRKARPKSVGGILDEDHVYDEIRGDTPKKKPPRRNKPESLAECADYSHLPPEQRKRKLQSIMDKLHQAIDNKEKEKCGAVKMQEVYKSNPSMGDPNSITGQINDLNAQLSKLNIDLEQHEKWYSECTGQSPARQKKSPNHNQVSNDVITKPSIPPPPAIAASNVTSQQENNEVQEQPQADEFDEFEDGNNAIGSCVAIYAYEGVDSAEINLEEGQVYQVLDADGGDGWTRIQDSDNNVGFVPTSYLEIDFYDQY